MSNTYAESVRRENERLVEKLVAGGVTKEEAERQVEQMKDLPIERVIEQAQAALDALKTSLGAPDDLLQLKNIDPARASVILSGLMEGGEDAPSE